MPFAQLNISILPGKATVDFPIVLLKSLLVNTYFTFQITKIHSSVKLKI